MPKKRRRQGRRLTYRTALNDLLKVLNPLLREDEQLMPVSKRKDLFGLQDQLRTPSTVKDAACVDPKASVQKIEDVPKSVIQALSIIATHAWRAKNKMLHSENGEVRDEMKRVYRHVEALFDSLTQIGIEVRDMRGHPYDSGMALKVVSFEPTQGLSTEKVTETIKPTITWRGRLVQMGEIIVGTPPEK